MPLGLLLLLLRVRKRVRKIIGVLFCKIKIKKTVTVTVTGTFTITTLRDSIFSTVPGSPAWVGKASRQKVDLPQFGLQWDRGDGHNAIQSEYKMEFFA